MPLLITADASTTHRRLMLRVGQEARVGRSEWLELSVPEDEALLDEHFVVRCGDDAVVEAIDQDACFVVGGEECKRLTLSNTSGEQTTFIAGETEFIVSWTPDLTRTVSHVAEKHEAEASDSPKIDVVRQIKRIAAVMSLSENAIELIDTDDQVDSFVDRLQEADLGDDAVRFIAGMLPTAVLVDWAAGNANLEASSSSTLIDVINRWRDAPSETERRDVKDSLEVTPCDNVTKWIAKAIVYSGGSLAPDGQPLIAPPIHLSAVAIVTAHRWERATQPDRKEAVGRWVDSGKQLIRTTPLDCLAKHLGVSSVMSSEGDS